MAARCGWLSDPVRHFEDKGAAPRAVRPHRPVSDDQCLHGSEDRRALARRALAVRALAVRALAVRALVRRAPAVRAQANAPSILR